MTVYQLWVHRRADSWWAIAVPELKLILSAQNLGEIAPAARAAIVAATGAESTSFGLRAHVDEDGKVAQAIVDRP